jgi:putative tryptophan/tyrosine transport system substrate-binding protein
MDMKHEATGRRKTFCFAICALLLVLGLSAEAQQAKKVPQIGYVSGSGPVTSDPRFDAFRLGLRDLGYIEGKNILLEYRYAEGKQDPIPSLVADLVELKVDVLVSPSLPAVASCPIQPMMLRVFGALHTTWIES